VYQVERLVKKGLRSPVFDSHLSHLSQVAPSTESPPRSCQHNGPRPAFARFIHRAPKLMTHRHRQRIERGGAIERNDGYAVVTHLKLDGFVTHNGDENLTLTSQGARQSVSLTCYYLLNMSSQEGPGLLRLMIEENGLCLLKRVPATLAYTERASDLFALNSSVYNY
jgi:hypothetical protein